MRNNHLDPFGLAILTILLSVVSLSFCRLTHRRYLPYLMLTAKQSKPRMTSCLLGFSLQLCTALYSFCFYRAAKRDSVMVDDWRAKRKSLHTPKKLRRSKLL